MATLRDRCQAFLEEKPHCSADELVAFVVSEKGRAASPKLDRALPLCLYFPNDDDRNDFILMIEAAMPGATWRKVL
ncbi:MAG: hypothetical protein KGZ68_04455 [Dechloromonas sp.]|nr:hypothetical protein [Dechloromonas sp.]